MQNKQSWSCITGSTSNVSVKVQSQAQDRGPIPVIWLLLFLPIFSDEVININLGIFIRLASICMTFDNPNTITNLCRPTLSLCSATNMQEGQPCCVRSMRGMPSWAGGHHSI